MSHSDVIPAIPKDEQVPVLETNVEDWIKSFFLKSGIHSALRKRLEAGAQKYGTAWSEVDLTTDLEEEILDAMNYVAMAAVRIERTLDKPPELMQYLNTLSAIALYLSRALDYSLALPTMEGPSSKDWLPQHGIDPAEAQERFQNVVNSD